MKDTHENEPVDLSLSEELAKAFKETEPTEEVDEVEEVEPEQTEDEEETEEQENEEDSDEDGEPEETDEEEQEEQDEEPEPIDPPQHWSAADRDRFSKLPVEAQSFVIERHKSMEADYTRKTQEVASIRKRGEALDEVIAPFRQEFQLAGMDDVAAIRQLFSVHDFLKRDPTKAVQWLAQTYGADLTQTEEDVDPHVAALRREVQQLHQERQQETLTAQQRQQQELVNQIKTFEEEKDESGNLKHPHFITVYDDMVKMIQSGLASDLQGAYDRAVRMRPDLQPATQREPVKPKTDKAKLAKRAKKAASGVKSSGASVKRDAPQSLRDEISALVDTQLNQ